MNLFVFFGCLIWGYEAIKVITIVVYIIAIVSSFFINPIQSIVDILIIILLIIFKFPILAVLWVPVICFGIVTISKNLIAPEEAISLDIRLILEILGMILYFIKF